MKHANSLQQHTLRGLALVAALLSATPPGIAQPAPCIDPVAFGARPNDDLDDRAELQAAVNTAIAARSAVCIGPGDWDITRNDAPGVAGLASISVAGANGLEIRGAGRSTRLRMMGPGRQRDWRLIDIGGGSTNVYLHGMTLDGTHRFDTEEQTHLLHLSGPVSSVKAERLWLSLPRLEGESGGDCVRLLGGSGAEVSDITLRRLVGLACDRSFVAFQRGVRRVRIHNSSSFVVGDQSIDFEPSGGPGIEDVTIANSRLARGPNAQGQYTVALGGDGEAVARRISMRSTTVLDGGVHVIDTDGVTLDRVVVRGAAVAPGLALHVRKRARNLQVRNSTLSRHEAAPAGPVVSIHHQSGQAPHDVSMRNCTLVQPGAAPVISIESLASFLLQGSKLVYTGAAGAAPAVSTRAVIAPLESIRVVDSRVDGPAEGLLRVAAQTEPPVTVVVTGNTARELTSYGVYFVNGLPAVPPVITGNHFGSVPEVLP